MKTAAAMRGWAWALQRGVDDNERAVPGGPLQEHTAGNRAASKGSAKWGVNWEAIVTIPEII